MKKLKAFKVPTGEIYTAEDEKGALEFVSVGDYGKERNIKADFLGITRHLNGVDDGGVLPLSEKWVITISTQHGCSMDCKFCDVPLVARGRNVSEENLDFQVITAIKNHPEVTHTKRLNVHYARMGEPTFNPDVLEHATTLKHSVANLLSADTVHPVVSTMMPRKNKNLEPFFFIAMGSDKKQCLRGRSRFAVVDKQHGRHATEMDVFRQHHAFERHIQTCELLTAALWSQICFELCVG